MRPEAAARRVDSFGRRFGRSPSHLYLAYHAAFPLALTPDLLYRIWANFQRDIHGKLLNIPWIAVADLLLSNLCDEVGHELYEMDNAVRNELLRRLKEEPQFGEKRINELSDFLLAYVRKDLNSSESDKQDFAQSQQLAALAYKDSERAARKLASAFNQAYQQDRAELVRLAALTETLEQPLSQFEKLLIYARTMGHYVRNNLKEAENQILKLPKEVDISVAGIVLQIPDQIKAILRARFLRDSRDVVEADAVVSPPNLNVNEIEIPNFCNLDFLEENPGFSSTIAKMEKSGATQYMPRVVISTVGTSLLTNQINRGNANEASWYGRLRDTANLTSSQIPEDVLYIIEELKNQASHKLREANPHTVRSSSAELNGIYGLYQEQLERGGEDMHWLITTDTALGAASAEIIRDFLQHQKFIVQIFQPSGLSTASADNFASGIDELLVWLADIIPPYKDKGYRICFNLAGSFKSLYTYMSIIGMFYADQMICMFEGANSSLLTIPRLPVKIDSSDIQPVAVEFALMAAGAFVKLSKLYKVPETFLFVVDDEATLSNWGRLIWNGCKEDLLSGKLLDFPRLKYEYSFLSDYEKINNLKEKLKLQETLSKVSHLLTKKDGDTTLLRQDGGLLFAKFMLSDNKFYNSDKFYHFRVNIDRRVSCQISDGFLLLRRYGTHESIAINP